METVEHFYNRIYVNHIREYALVYPNKRGIGEPKKWTLVQLTQYLDYLKESMNHEPWMN